MKEWLEILSSLPGSLARVGFIIALFSIGVMVAESRGLNFPAVVSEWSNPALVFGLVLVAVDATLQGIRGIIWCFGWLARRRSLREQERRLEVEAMENLRTLDANEFDLLFRMLSSGEKRFQVGGGPPAPSLMQKNILIFKQAVGRYSWICELNPAIEKHRTEILKAMEAQGASQA
jgi:hypothetical protein